MSRPPERLNAVNRARHLLSPLWFLVALIGLIAGVTVSGNAAHGTETRVRAFDTPTAIVVESGTTESPGGVGHLRQVSAAFVSATGVATNKVDDLVGAVCSFSGETRVLMADGTTKPISEIEVGDEVLAYDPETGERGPREVTHLWIHRDTLVDLEVGESPITTTEDHPFWNVTDRAWQPAVELDTGDLVLTAGGGTLRVDGLDWSTTSVGTAYNLTVDGIHTYFVQAGSEEILVHNTCPGVGGLAGEFDADELAQLTYQHVGAGDIAGRPSLLEIETAINRATPVRLPGQNAVQFEYNGVRVIINEDIPTRSTAYYPGG
jgi:Pretoxin HINT domain